MAHVPPWHFQRVNDQEVHHDNDTCTEGNIIEVYNRAPGSGGRPRCEHCRLAQSSK